VPTLPDDLVLWIVRVLVDTNDVHRRISRGSRDDDSLGPALDVGVSLLNGGEAPGGLDDVLSTVRPPWDVLGIFPDIEQMNNFFLKFNKFILKNFSLLKTF